MSLFVLIVASSTLSVAANELADPKDAPSPTMLQQPSPIRFVSPHDGEAVKGAVSVVVEVADQTVVDHVSISAGGSTLGVLFAPPYEVAWNTKTEADGPYLLVARVRGKDLGELGASRINVAVDNTPPTIAWVSPKDGDLLRGTVSLEVAPSDLVGVKGVRFLVNGNGIADLTAPPYVFQWNTELVPNIRYALEAKVFDRANNSAITTPPLTVRVVNRNRAPMLEPIPPQTIREGQFMDVTVKAADPDGARDPLTFKASHLPPWAQLDTHTGRVTGTPGFSVVPPDPPQLDYKDVRIAVCDPEPLCDNGALRITAVNSNSPPTLESPGDRTIREGERLTIKLVSSDPESDPLTCRVIDAPQWMTFDASTCTLTGIPGPGVATLASPEHVYQSVGFEVCDPEKQCDTKMITITALDIENRAPVFDSIEDQHIDEGKLLFFVVRAHDPDGDRMVLDAPELSSDKSFLDRRDGTGVFSWTPRMDQSGTYEVTFTATDTTLTSSELVTIVVAERGLTISGTVREAATKHPIKGATIQILTPPPERQLLKEFTTNEKGFYVTSVLPQGLYEVRPGYLMPEFTFALGSRRAGGMVFIPPSYYNVSMTDHDQTKLDFKAYPPRVSK